MVGYSTMLEVKVWVQTNNFAHTVLVYWPESNKSDKHISTPVLTRKDQAYVAHLIADEVEPGTKYGYDILINGESIDVPYPLKFETQELWQWRRDASDFSFLAGSCFYVNETKYDRPGTPYGSGHEILDAMAEEEVNFMLWLGDNTYLREVDWNSWTGIIHRNTHTRSYPGLQPLLGDIHHYAIWDDHDYGPNDSDRSYWGKDMTMDAFQLFWANPNYNVTGKGGITGTFMWNDCQFFLLDNRWFRSSEQYDGQILGEDQILWLIEALRFSQASFKFICIGGQFLSDAKIGDNHANFELERSMILNKIDEHDIPGVVFINGDRHSSEISTWTSNRGNIYYEATCSSITAGSSDHSSDPNNLRVEGSMIGQNNYTIFNVTGPQKDRKLEAIFKDIKGKELYRYTFDFTP
jgi:alkaline phosphatase D